MFFAPAVRTRAYRPRSASFDRSFERFVNEPSSAPAASGVKVEQDERPGP